MIHNYLGGIETHDIPCSTCRQVLYQLSDIVAMPHSQMKAYILTIPYVFLVIITNWYMYYFTRVKEESSLCIFFFYIKILFLYTKYMYIHVLA